MKHLLALALILAILFTGCTVPVAMGTTEPAEQTTLFEQNPAVTEAVPVTSAEPEPSPATSVAPSPNRLEFPITVEGECCAVPDFLDEDQVTAYRRMVSAIPMFYGDSYTLDYAFPVRRIDQGKEYPIIDIHPSPDFCGTSRYMPLYGKCRTMAQLREICEAIMTPDFFDRLNGHEPFRRIFIEFDGRLYRIYGNVANPPGYDRSLDTFGLTSRSDSEIRFTVTCTYYWSGGEADPATRSGEIVMVNTPVGWRFDRFYAGVLWDWTAK